jgi:hypothetical protein
MPGHGLMKTNWALWLSLCPKTNKRMRKMRNNFRALPIFGGLALVSVSLLLGCTAPGVKKVPEATAAPAATTPPVQTVSADALLQDMARFLAATPRFSVDVKSHFDVLQNSGQMIEFGENRTITVSRPDRFRIEAEQSDGDRHLVTYDGKDITIFSPGQKVYAQVAKPGGIDAAVTYFLRNLRMRMPLALMLRSDLPKELKARTGEVDYVERTRIDGQPAHHIAGRTDTVDYQFWIADGPKPLPLRVVLSYKTVEGEPQFRGQFVNWNLTPVLTDAEFAFKPPEGARKIAFLAELAETRNQDTVSPEPSGEQK